METRTSSSNSISLTAPRVINRIAVVVAIASSLGCAVEHDGIFSDHLHLDTSRVPCRHGDKTIEILQDLPDRPFANVAYLEAFASFYAENLVSWDELREELCRQAAEMQSFRSR